MVQAHLQLLYHQDLCFCRLLTGIGVSAYHLSVHCMWCHCPWPPPHTHVLSYERSNWYNMFTNTHNIHILIILKHHTAFIIYHSKQVHILMQNLLSTTKMMQSNRIMTKFTYTFLLDAGYSNIKLTIIYYQLLLEKDSLQGQTVQNTAHSPQDIYACEMHACRAELQYMHRRA